MDPSRLQLYARRFVMWKKTVLLFATAAIAAFTLSLSGCSSETPDQKIARNIAENFTFQYEIVTNQGAQDGLECQDLGAEWASCNKVNLSITNRGNEVLSSDWKIYFHSIRQILQVDSDHYKITHITGDLHTIEPTERFTGIATNETVKIPYIGEYWTLFEGDYMPRAYVTVGESTPLTIVSMDTEDPSSYVVPITGELYKRTPDDNNVLATAQTRFENNSDTPLLERDKIASVIIPQPINITRTGDNVRISNGITFQSNVLSSDMTEAIKNKFTQLGVSTDGQYPIEVSISTNIFNGDYATSGAYTLGVGNEKTVIVGYDNLGAFYAVQSLLSLIEQGGQNQIPTVTVKDAPRMKYRGFMVDVARNFHSKEAILRTIDIMSSYKMNVLHFHLTDDEGWRIEIPGLPELTEIGGKRAHDLTETTALLPQLGSGPGSDNFGSGFYSREEYIEILRYAKARGVEVTPEIDMPAHARAAVVSMEARYNRLAATGDMNAANEYRLMDPLDESNVTTVQFYDKRSFINPCLESSLNFVDKVIGEIAQMHSEAGMELTTWHFGGDEAKNIKRGGGFQDINAEEKVAWRGDIDQSIQHVPFEKSPVAQQAIANGVVEDFEHLPSYFAEQVSIIAKRHGIPHFQAWQDGLKYSESANSFESDDVRVNFWETLYWGGASGALEWAKKGYQVIVSNPDYLYLDFPYEVDPKEPGYYWATRATDTRKIFTFAPVNLPQNAETSLDRDGNAFTSKADEPHSNIYGMSTQLWSETVRNDEQYEFKVFPRLIASAERAWHRADWELDYRSGREYTRETNRVDKDALTADWTAFANTLGQRELTKLDALGVTYRLPIPGAKITDGKLAMNISIPGLPIQYSIDNGERWNEYNDHNRPTVSGSVLLRSTSSDGKRFSRVTSL